jgi:signal peptidase II
LFPTIQKYKTPLFTVLTVLLIDQFIKIYIKLNFPLGEVARAADWCIIHFTENPGMAFGFEFGGDYGKVILSVFRIVACFIGVFYIRYLVLQREHIGFIFSVSLILAGALGNIIDSVFYGVFFSESDEFNVSQFLPQGGGYAGILHGRVVDMFYFPLWNGIFPSWVPFVGGEPFQFFRPIFNFADTAISCGVGIIILFQKRFSKKQPDAPAQDAVITENPVILQNDDPASHINSN